MKMQSEIIRKVTPRQASGLRRATAIGAVLALLLGLDAGRAGAAPKPCGDYVATGSVYSCNLTPLVGTPFHDCLTIASSGGPGFDFTLPLFDGSTVACGCDATGSAKPIPLSSHSSFTCDTADVTSGTPIAFSGKLAAGGKKIVAGNIIYGGSFVWAFSCNLDPGCTP